MNITVKKNYIETLKTYLKVFEDKKTIAIWMWLGIFFWIEKEKGINLLKEILLDIMIDK
jgi:hypothetical protein